MAQGNKPHSFEGSRCHIMYIIFTEKNNMKKYEYYFMNNVIKHSFNRDNQMFNQNEEIIASNPVRVEQI